MWVPPGQLQTPVGGFAEHTALPLTQFYLFHGILTEGAIEGARADALEAIHCPPIQAFINLLTAFPSETRGAFAVPLFPGATVFTGAWETGKGNQMGPDCSDRNSAGEEEKRAGNRWSHLG